MIAFLAHTEPGHLILIVFALLLALGWIYAPSRSGDADV